MVTSQTPISQGSAAAPWGPYELRPSPRAIFRLTLGSSVAVATALTMPDAFAILPGTPDAVSWAMRVLGLWLSAYILWATGFLAILHLTRIISGGIVLDADGIKLWRFGKKIPWARVVFTTIAARANFSKLLLIKPMALELSLHVSKGKEKKGFDVKKVPSFQYEAADFASLLYYVGKFAFGVEANSIGTFMFKPAETEQLRKMSQEGRLKRRLLSAIISCSLLLFLARNAATHYTFNMGNMYARKSDYVSAIYYYTMSTSVNPFFPPAWDRLARSELRSGDPASAVEHWQRALQVKPDFVESKLGLSVVYMRQWQLEEAQKLIRQCIRLAPKDEASYINLAQIDSLMGNHREAIKILSQVSEQSRARDLARCLLAQCYMRIGELEKAAQLIPTEDIVNDPHAALYRRLVKAELALASGDLPTADALLAKLYRGDKHVDLLMNLAKLKIEQKDLKGAEKILTELEKKQSSTSSEGGQTARRNPWIAYCRAKIGFMRGDGVEGQWMVEQALKTPYEDPSLIANCAILLLDKNGSRQRAQQLLERACRLDSQNKIVQSARQKLEAK